MLCIDNVAALYTLHLLILRNCFLFSYHNPMWHCVILKDDASNLTKLILLFSSSQWVTLSTLSQWYMEIYIGYKKSRSLKDFLIIYSYFLSPLNLSPWSLNHFSDECGWNIIRRGGVNHPGTGIITIFFLKISFPVLVFDALSYSAHDHIYWGL